jgi:hypothetical protein
MPATTAPRQQYIVLATDGQPDGTQETPLADAAAAAKAKGQHIITIGMGSNVDEKLLASIADVLSITTTGTSDAVKNANKVADNLCGDAAPAQGEDLRACHTHLAATTVVGTLSIVIALGCTLGMPCMHVAVAASVTACYTILGPVHRALQQAGLLHKTLAGCGSNPKSTAH